MNCYYNELKSDKKKLIKDISDIYGLRIGTSDCSEFTNVRTIGGRFGDDNLRLKNTFFTYRTWHRLPSFNGHTIYFSDYQENNKLLLIDMGTYYLHVEIYYE